MCHIVIRRQERIHFYWIVRNQQEPETGQCAFEVRHL